MVILKITMIFLIKKNTVYFFFLLDFKGGFTPPTITGIFN